MSYLITRTKERQRGQTARRFGASKHTPLASYNWWNTKKIWVLGAARKSSKLLLIIGALGTEGRAAPPDLGKILIRFARNMS